MTAIERMQHFVNGNYIGKLDLKDDIETLLKDSKLQEQYVTQLESNNEKLRKIVNILCDTISQLMEQGDTISQLMEQGDTMLTVQIDIPKKFELEFERDRFKDSLERLALDIHRNAGNYERETAEMLVTAFQNGKVIK